MNEGNTNNNKQADDKQWIETSSGNRIHKTCKIKGSNYIVIAGNSTINNNCNISVSKKESSINIGKYCYINDDVCIESSANSIKIGSYTSINTGTIIHNCANVGSRVKVGKNCRLNRGSVIYDCCIIEDNVIVPIGYVIPPFSIVKYIGVINIGNEPQRIESKLNFVIEDLPESYKKINEIEVKRMVLLK